jgi:hypothetical protein
MELILRQPRPDLEAGPGAEATATCEAPPCLPRSFPRKRESSRQLSQRSANKDDHQACRAFHALRWLDSRFRGSERRLGSRLGRIPNLAFVQARLATPSRPPPPASSGPPPHLRHSGEGRNPSKCTGSGARSRQADATQTAARVSSLRPQPSPPFAMDPGRESAPEVQPAGTPIESAARPASPLNSVACANRAQPCRPRAPCSRQHTRPYNPRIVPTR